jgi:hypothetical protein
LRCQHACGTSLVPYDVRVGALLPGRETTRMTAHPRRSPQSLHRVSWLRRLRLRLVLGLAVSQAHVHATLSPDGTLGTTVTQPGGLYTITGGTRLHNGPNLFHRVDRLSV